MRRGVRATDRIDAERFRETGRTRRGRDELRRDPDEYFLLMRAADEILQKSISPAPVRSIRCSRLPDLVAVGDIRGELHAHTTSSNGMHTIEEMAEAARERDYEYLGITDHSQSLKIARGLSEDALWEQIRMIDRLNAGARSRAAAVSSDRMN